MSAVHETAREILIFITEHAYIGWGGQQHL